MHTACATHKIRQMAKVVHRSWIRHYARDFYSSKMSNFRFHFLWTVWTSASGKRFYRILPVQKLHSLSAAIGSKYKKVVKFMKICKIHENLK